MRLRDYMIIGMIVILGTFAYLDVTMSVAPTVSIFKFYALLTVIIILVFLMQIKSNDDATKLKVESKK